MDESIKAKHLADLDYFHSLMEKEPESTYYLPVALINSILEQNDEVVRVCKKGLEKFPGFSQLKVLYASGLIQMGNREDAVNLLLDVIISDKFNFLALKLMGIMYRETGFKAESAKYLRAAYLLAPEDTQIMAWLDEMGALSAATRQEDTGASKETEELHHEHQLIEDTAEYIKTAREIMEELAKDVAAAKKAGRKPDELLLNPYGTSVDALQEEEKLSGAELSDDAIMHALASSTPDKELFDDDDDSFYDFSKGVNVIDPSEYISGNIVNSAELPFDDELDDADDDEYDDNLTDSFIPVDLVSSVLSESGIGSMEDIFSEEDRITPESIKGGKNAE